jgi:serine/threonine-protein kinase
MIRTCKEAAMSEDLLSDPPGFSANALVGAYRIEERIGAGGMAVVYRATDTKLARNVALKVIRTAVLHDEGLARFEREARVLASLNHPRIAAIHGIEESAGTQFLVLEYVPGPTLADRLRRGRLPIREAMLAGKQIAEAVEAAHTRGIIHRDLKPANIKLADNGQVKVLDFGLAKPVERARTVATDTTVTLSESVTSGISIAGTAAYMSPEQACGKELDSRTDLWSFGCVLYEMLSGKQAFCGGTLTEILAAVVEREPDWKALPTETSAPVQALLKRCLRKDPASRLRDIGDARIELEDALSAPATDAAKPSGMTRRTAISGLAGAAAGAGTMGVFAISRWRGAVPHHLTRFAIAAPEPGVFVTSFNRRVAISPDGTLIAFNTSVPGVDEFYLRSLSGLDPKRVKDVRSGGAAFFSTDGRWIGFITTTLPPLEIKKLAVTGGAPTTICAHGIGPAGVTWADDDTIYWVDVNPGD